MEHILKKLEDINLSKEIVVSRENEDPDRTRSGWGDLNFNPLQLFIEYKATMGLGYHDSFYWNPPNQLPSEYKKLKCLLRINEIEDEWDAINIDPAQIPEMPPLTF